MRGPKTSLILMRFTDTADEMGSMTRQWKDLMFIEGVFWSLSGDEVEKFSKLNEEITHMFLVKFFTHYYTPDTKDRLRTTDGTSVYEIKFIDDSSNRSGWWRISLKEYKDNG